MFLVCGTHRIMRCALICRWWEWTPCIPHPKITPNRILQRYTHYLPLVEEVQDPVSTHVHVEISWNICCQEAITSSHETKILRDAIASFGVLCKFTITSLPPSFRTTNETVTIWYKSLNNQWKSSMCGRICKNNPCRLRVISGWWVLLISNFNEGLGIDLACRQVSGFPSRASKHISGRSHAVGTLRLLPRTKTRSAFLIQRCSQRQNQTTWRIHKKTRVVEASYTKYSIFF